jgi:hypothetical protein
MTKLWSSTVDARFLKLPATVYRTRHAGQGATLQGRVLAMALVYCGA